MAKVALVVERDREGGSFFLTYQLPFAKSALCMTLTLIFFNPSLLQKWQRFIQPINPLSPRQS
jgi:hypothetical protein